MPYRSGFEFQNGGMGPYFGAIPPAAILSASIGMGILAVWAVLTMGPIEGPGPSPLEFALMITTAAFGFGMAIVGATFVVGFYLALFGLPVALLMGRYLHYRWALAVALFDAGGSALLAATGSRLGIVGTGDFSIRTFLMVLCFALPAGYFYRRSVIALREEAAIFA